MYVKQQHIGSGGPSDLFKSTSMHDSINALQSNFADIGIKDTQMVLIFNFFFILEINIPII